MKITYVYTDKWETEYIASCLPKESFIFLPGIINDYATFDQETQALVVFIDSRVDAQILHALPHLKLIVTRSTGFNNIDLATAQSKKITVCNVPAYATHTVAEYTWALLLNLTRKIRDSIDRPRRGSFSRNELMGTDVHGKTIGIVGTGNIGAQVARIARSFGMNVLAYDVYPNNTLAQQLGFTYVPFEQLLAQSDIISMHVTYNAQTHHMINLKNINTCKRGAYLINTARGEIVQTEALIQGLDSGILAGMALDVIEEEWLFCHEIQAITKTHTNEELKRLVAIHYLLNHPQVIITPHNAFNSVEARKQRLDITIENIKAWQANKAINIVS